MSVFVHREIAYGFRRTVGFVAAEDLRGRQLARVEALLIDAGNAFRARRYRDAIDSYEAVQALVWAQLFPARGILSAEGLAASNLFEPLVSVAGDWLNVLPVETPKIGVHPRVDFDVDAPEQLGLLGSGLRGRGPAAVARLHTAALLRAAGDPAADRFRDLAAELAPELVKAIEEHGGIPRNGDGPVDVVARPPGRRMVGDTEFASGPPTVGPTPSIRIPPEVTGERTFAFRTGEGEVRSLTWAHGDVADPGAVLAEVYATRRFNRGRPDLLLAPTGAADVAVSLPHMWHYEVPLGLAECHHALGEWTTAEMWYLSAARYEFLTEAVEVPYLWGRLATLYLDWGDALFRADDPAAALAVYERVLRLDATAPDSELYATPGLAPAAHVAREVIARLREPEQITASPSISAVLFDVWARLQRIDGGLDFWGHWAAGVPIWTFDYLQAAAITFGQLAVGAERDAMAFWEKSDQGRLTRTQLAQNTAQALAEYETVSRQRAAAEAESDAYEFGVLTAEARARQANAAMADYTTKSWAWTLQQALSAQMSGGEDGDPGVLTWLANRRMQGDSHLPDAPAATDGAAAQLAAARLQRQYEIDALGRQVADLARVTVQARAELRAATARVSAAVAGQRAAQLRVAHARQLVAAFDDQRFGPDVWHALGDRMNRLAQRYLAMALDMAKRMQQAYNFENDTALAVIRPDYSGDTVEGLLAADTLLADVHSFTYDLVMSSAPKRQPLRQTVSLAERHPFAFETQLRRTGRMDFQTSLDDFDTHYPGTYAGRILHVQVDVDGIVPARGRTGTLTNAGISVYRLPSRGWTPEGSGVKYRVQNRETLVLSDFDPVTDALLSDGDRRRLRIFQGAGVASSWTLELPKEINDLDYEAITDVRLTFTYEARFDPDLRDRVLAELRARPTVNERQRPLPLRWLFPDAFFSFYADGVLEFALGARDFPAPQTDPVLGGLSLVLTATPRASAGGVVLAVTAPGRAAVTVTTAADGTVAAADLAAATGGSALGEWRIELRAADNPGLVVLDRLALDHIDNLAVLLSYAFTPRI